MNPLTVLMPQDGEIDSTPSYLFDHSQLYKTNAHDAGLAWYREASFGLGIHFGLYSLLGKGENALTDGVLTPELYGKLTTKMDAMRFDATDIVEFAIANGMRYINFCVRGADGFSLYNTRLSDYNSTKTPAKRDLLGELASVCEFHGIGLCLNYSHGRDLNRLAGTGTPSVMQLLDYQEFMMGQIEELLTQYGPIAAICLNGADIPLAAMDTWKSGIEDLYKFVRNLQPQVLLSYEQGITSTEDFFTCVDAIPAEDSPADIQGFIHKQADKPFETRISLTPGFWGYNADQAGKHLKSDVIWEKLREAQSLQTNLLVNTALMPDGSLDYEDMQNLLDVGQKIEKGGYPRG